MSFDPLPIVAVARTRGQRDERATISYRRTKIKGARLTPRPVLWVGIPKTACAGFSADKQQRFEIALGHGADAGKLRIAPSAATWEGVKARHLRGGLVIRFGFVPMLGEAIGKIERVPVEPIAGDGFLLALPSWFYTAALATAERSSADFLHRGT